MWFVSAKIVLSFCPIRGRPVHIPHIFYEEPSKYGTRRYWALKYIFVFPPIIYLFGQLEIYGQRRKYIFKYVLVRLSPGDIIIVGDSHLVTLSALLERHWASSGGEKPLESGKNHQNQDRRWISEQTVVAELWTLHKICLPRSYLVNVHHHHYVDITIIIIMMMKITMISF